ncbi:hypothetical protein [Nocardia alni]|uniref:hypothetical protein n=1 Tax=Nocardia alni TaxID=2815723 RepID=UPI001C22FB88|nr:hypothetical protein [Nocardia alni]
MAGLTTVQRSAEQWPRRHNTRIVPLRTQHRLWIVTIAPIRRQDYRAEPTAA